MVGVCSTRVRVQAQSIFDMTSCIFGHRVYKNVWMPKLGDELECKKGGDKEVLLLGIYRLPLTSTLWPCWTFLLTSLSSFADKRVQSFLSGSIVFLTLLMCFNMVIITCGFVLYF